MSKRAVLNLLGPPDTTREAGEVYYLGRSPYGVSYEVYVIQYDEQDRLARFSATGVARLRLFGPFHRSEKS